MKPFIKTSLFQVLLPAVSFVLSGNTNKPNDDGTGIVKYPPVSTFESSCARCHGPQGTFYGKTFGQLPDKELEKFIREMMNGPGGLNPSQADIDAMTAYNKALAQHRPFIFITSADTTTNSINYSGESLPGTTISLTGKGETRHIKTGDNGKWQTGPVTPSEHPVLIAVNEADTVKLVPGKAMWTN